VSTLAPLAVCACVADDWSATSSENALDDNQLSDASICTDPAHLNAPLPCPASAGTPDFAIRPGLIDNASLFDDPFYARFPLRKRSLQLNDEVTKDYSFPTRYRDTTTSVAMFFCDRDKAKAMMPDPALEPVDMGLGRSLLVISSFRYNRIAGMTPYNEVAIAIPTVAGRTFNPPILPLLLHDFRGLGFYLQSMPVTALENKIRGTELWGIAKVVRPIELAVDGNDYVTTVKDENGEAYLETRVPMTGESMHVDNETFIYSRLDGVTLRTSSHVLGDFQVTKHLETLALPLGVLKARRSRSLVLGDSPAAKALNELDIAPHPFQVRFSTGTSNVLDLPDAKLDADGKPTALPR
jgi:hypothetical protein